MKTTKVQIHTALNHPIATRSSLAMLSMRREKAATATASYSKSWTKLMLRDSLLRKMIDRRHFSEVAVIDVN